MDNNLDIKIATDAYTAAKSDLSRAKRAAGKAEVLAAEADAVLAKAESKAWLAWSALKAAKKTAERIEVKEKENGNR
jgi:hypothetical protein